MGTRLLSTLDSLSGSGALIMTKADPKSTLAVDLFSHCIGEPFSLLQISALLDFDELNEHHRRVPTTATMHADSTRHVWLHCA